VVLTAIIAVIAVYVTAALGTTMLIGADRVVQNEKVALNIAGKQAFGIIGLIVVTVAAAFFTGSAINSTLFAIARLTHEAATDGRLPAVLDHRNRNGIPDRAVNGLGIMAADLATVETLSILVEAASLAFLFTFAIVYAIAFRERAEKRLITGMGALADAAASAALIDRLLDTDPYALIFLAFLVLTSGLGRPLLLRHIPAESPRD
jgi:amino acid transporter